MISDKGDNVGLDTLEAVSAAPKFNKWMFSQIQPFLKGPVLEIGSGIGNMSRLLIESFPDSFLSDFDKGYWRHLKEQFGEQEHVREVIHMDLVDKDFDRKFGKYFGTMSSVFALNVVEHIEDHKLAVENAKKLIVSGGNIIILVPAFQVLFNKFDVGLGHYRRYTKSSLSALMTSNNISVIESRYFNLLGVFGWFLDGRLLKKKSVSNNRMKIYDSILPIAKFLDMIMSRFIGLSVIVVGRV